MRERRVRDAERRLRAQDANRQTLNPSTPYWTVTMPVRRSFHVKPLAQAVLFTLAAGAAGLAGAAVCTWNGAASHLWSGANWSGCAVPTDGDGLAFGAGAAFPGNINDIAGLDLDGLAFTSAGGYSVTLGGIGIGQGIASLAGYNQLTGAITQTAGSPIYVVAAGSTLDVQATLDLGGHEATFNVTGNLNLAGAIAGTSNDTLTFNQTGFTRLSGNNTFFGRLDLNAGALEAAGSQPFGSENNGIRVGADGTLMLSGTDIAKERLDLMGGAGANGQGQVYVGASAIWRGVVDLRNVTGDATIKAAVAGSGLTLAGPVFGGGGITLLGPGYLALANWANSFTGTIRLNTDGAGGILRVDGHDEVIPDSVSIRFTNLSPLGTLDLAGHTESVGDIQGTGRIELGAGTLAVGGNGIDSNFGGAIGGTGQLRKIGPETLTLSGTNSHTGGTRVEGGVLSLSGAGTLGAVDVAGGATLEVGRAATTGAIQVATGGGLTLAGGVDSGHTGNLLLSPGATFGTHIPNSNSNIYGNVNVAGSVSLNGVILSVDLAYVPAPGMVFTLIDNDGNDPIAGTFGGLPQGAGFVANGVTLYVDYQGGDGNDLTVSTTPLPAPVSAAPAAIPTLTEWGMVLLSGLLGLVAARTTRRRIGGNQTET